MHTDAPQQRRAVTASGHNVSICGKTFSAADCSRHLTRAHLQGRHFSAKPKFNALLPGVVRKCYAKPVSIACLVGFKHGAKYLEQREEDGAAVRGNREKALLSHCFTKAMVQGWVDANPCRGVHRNRERPRERMIEDAEAGAVFAIA